MAEQKKLNELSKNSRVYLAIAAGARTVHDIEAIMDEDGQGPALPRKIISAHCADLVRMGDVHRVPGRGIKYGPGRPCTEYRVAR